VIRNRGIVVLDHVGMRAPFGIALQALLQRVLQERAEDLLARGNLTQSEIAFLLGYSEVSAFSRAYCGWTGHSPGGRTVVRYFRSFLAGSLGLGSGPDPCGNRVAWTVCSPEARS
jgi:AraC-like DNA-binding protein